MKCNNKIKKWTQISHSVIDYLFSICEQKRTFLVGSCFRRCCRFLFCCCWCEWCYWYWCWCWCWCWLACMAIIINVADTKFAFASVFEAHLLWFFVLQSFRLCWLHLFCLLLLLLLLCCCWRFYVTQIFALLTNTAKAAKNLAWNKFALQIESQLRRLILFWTWFWWRYNKSHGLTPGEGVGAWGAGGVRAGSAAGVNVKPDAVRMQLRAQRLCVRTSLPLTTTTTAATAAALYISRFQFCICVLENWRRTARTHLL